MCGVCVSVCVLVTMIDPASASLQAISKLAK